MYNITLIDISMSEDSVDHAFWLSGGNATSSQQEILRAETEDAVGAGQSPEGVNVCDSAGQGDRNSVYSQGNDDTIDVEPAEPGKDASPHIGRLYVLVGR